MPARIKFWADPKWLTLLLSILLIGSGVAWRDGERTNELKAIREDISRHERTIERVAAIAEDVAEIKGLLKDKGR